MDIAGFAHKIDDALIDKVFQPILDFCWAGKSAWKLGLNFQLGSLVLLAFSIFYPLFFGIFSFSLNVQNLLAFIAGLVLFLGFSRMHIVERAGMGNPLRPALFTCRLLVLGFSFYDVFSIFTAHGPLALSNNFASLSDIVFLIGLYCMACRTSPPRQKKRKQMTSYAWQGNS